MLLRLALALCVLIPLVSSPVVADGPRHDVCRAAVQPFVDRQELAGAVMLVADRRRVLDVEAVGWANIAESKPMAENSMFWIASQSKPVTAVALMLLVDEGKVNLDQTIDTYLPEFRELWVVSDARQDQRTLKRLTTLPTVRQVLAHTAGFPFKSPLEEPTLDLYPLAARVRSYAMLPLDAEPGAKFQYSNEGINIAGRIIEVVSGQPFEVFLDKRLLAPLGMRDTTFWPSEEQLSRVATAYKAGADNKGLEVVNIPYLQEPYTDRGARAAMPAGGLFSTAGDLARFYQMVLNEGEFEGKRILSAKAVGELTRRQTPANMKESWGLGFTVGETTFGHGGAYSTNSTADRQRGQIHIWLVQHAGFPGEGAKAQDAFRAAALETLKP